MKAQRQIYKDSQSVKSDSISGPNYLEILEDNLKGDYMFVSMGDTARTIVPNYAPKASVSYWKSIDNYFEIGEEKNYDLRNAFFDRNIEDYVSIQSANPLDNKLEVTLHGYQLKVKALESGNGRVHCLASSGNVVRRVSSDATNAHGALASQPNFPGNYVLCCNFGNGGTFCGADNKILGLSSETNAHAEQPDLVSPTYTTSVCYDSLKDARTTEEGCSSGDNEVSVLFISNSLLTSTSPNNAHIGGILVTQNYASEICAKVVSVPVDCAFTDAYWELNGAPIVGGPNGNSVVPVGTNVQLVAKGTSQCINEEVEFVIIEDSGVGTISVGSNPFSDDGAGGSVSKIPWTTSLEDVGLDYAFFHFNATQAGISNTINSKAEGNPMLEVFDPTNPQITYCYDYDYINQCNQDPEDVADYTIESPLPGKGKGIGFCSQPGYDCFCYWDSAAAVKCDAGFTTPSGGFCSWRNEVIQECDDVTGIMIIKSIGTWIGDPDDPGRIACEEEQPPKTTECPAQIALPFFGLYNIIAVVLIVALA